MVFFGEIEEAAFNSAELGCLEGFLALPDWDAVVFSALDNKDRAVPFFDEGDWVKNGVGFLGNFVVFFPVWPAEIPVVEEDFFGCSVHALGVEDAVVGDEGFEAVVVDSGEIEGGIATVASSDAA